MRQTAISPLALAAAAIMMFVASTPMRAVQNSSASADDGGEPLPGKTHVDTTPLKNNMITTNADDVCVTKVYVYAPQLKDAAISLEIKHGVVTLTGTVAQESHKALAQATVTNLPGVIRVDNQLTLRTEHAAKSPDTSIGKKVKSGTPVAATPEPARRIASEKSDDASGTASSVNTKDETRGSEVTSTGIAKNVAETPQVSKFLAETRGETSVNNPTTGGDAVNK